MRLHRSKEIANNFWQGRRNGFKVEGAGARRRSERVYVMMSPIADNSLHGHYSAAGHRLCFGLELQWKYIFENPLFKVGSAEPLFMEFGGVGHLLSLPHISRTPDCWNSFVRFSSFSFSRFRSHSFANVFQTLEQWQNIIPSSAARHYLYYIAISSYILSTGAGRDFW